MRWLVGDCSIRLVVVLGEKSRVRGYKVVVLYRIIVLFGRIIVLFGGGEEVSSFFLFESDDGQCSSLWKKVNPL